MLTRNCNNFLHNSSNEKYTLDELQKEKFLTYEKMDVLADENRFKDAWKTYYREFVRYDCSGPEDAKVDVPGRNATAHGWFKDYPSRKASLNAILFTDVILHMETI